MKTDAVFKRAFNDTLDLLAELKDGEQLPSENRFCSKLGVSRTTVRKVLSILSDKGMVSQTGRKRIFRASRDRAKRFPEDETISTSAQVEKRFMDWMLRDNPGPGTVINELELARHFGVATTGIREFLNRFQHFGLIERRRHGGWLLHGFTTKFALELFEIREMFELRSGRAFAALSENSAIWKELNSLLAEHLQLLEEIEIRYHDFSDLDSRFHRLINSVVPNRFIEGFQDVIALIFHYHYQWNKRDERQRNEVAIREHVTYIEALLSRNESLIELACKAHLTSAKETLIRSTSGHERNAANREKAERAS
jgi:DNA-binding GntR family transcriptional regulator